MSQRLQPSRVPDHARITALHRLAMVIAVL
jgi:hypothetical protein